MRNFGEVIKPQEKAIEDSGAETIAEKGEDKKTLLVFKKWAAAIGLSLPLLAMGCGERTESAPKNQDTTKLEEVERKELSQESHLFFQECLNSVLSSVAGKMKNGNLIFCFGGHYYEMPEKDLSSSSKLKNRTLEYIRKIREIDRENSFAPSVAEDFKEFLISDIKNEIREWGNLVETSQLPQQLKDAEAKNEKWRDELGKLEDEKAEKARQLEEIERKIREVRRNK